ncbi:MAG: glycosyltransferase [Longimicrobiales bacterium]|nr:glycosyltransferase [Longimicrobiales bacterium]
MTIEAFEGRCVAQLIETDGPGGAEQVVVLLARALREAGARSVVFVPSGGEGWIAERLAGSGVELEEFTLNRALSPGCFRSLRATLRSCGVEIAHSHEFGMAIYGGLAARSLGIPHLITMHGSNYYARHTRRRAALRLAARFSGPLIAVSEPLRQSLIGDLGLSGSEVRVVTNGVPLHTATRPVLRDELDLPPDARLVVAVGNLYPVKGHVHLVRALALLSREMPGVHVAIAGRGMMESRLKSLARELGVADRLHLLDLRTDVPNVLASAEVFALPSLSEGLPLALLEAMFAGLPIVATRVGQVPDVLEEAASGLLVPPEDPAALAAALATLLKSPARARALGLRARARAEECYSVSAMVACYAGVYQELLGPASRDRRSDRASPRPSSPQPPGVLTKMWS